MSGRYSYSFPSSDHPPVPAQPASADSPAIGAPERNAVVTALGKELRENYVFPEVAEKLAKALASKAAKGGYRTANTGAVFAQALTQDLRATGEDAHFRVKFAPDFQPRPGQDTPPTAEQVAEGRLQAASFGFGIERVQRLPGKVGYLKIDGFGLLEFVAPAYSAALSLLTGTQALIVDLRQNRGGEPDSVVYLLSHFFAEGDKRHLNDIYQRRTNTTCQYWTDASVGPRYSQPIYLLISPQTYSGAEECAYDLQAQKRATLVGETTGGAANPGEYVPLSKGFIAFIPTGRPINPVTRKNWERVGVKPDIAVPANNALKAAYTAILQGFIQQGADPHEREELSGALESIDSVVADLPMHGSQH